MITTSFIYQYTAPAAGNTREPVIIDCDFNPVFINPDSQLVLEYAGLSGMRQNNAGIMSDSGEFSARLIGLFDVENSPIFVINTPRAGDSINPFDGISISPNNPFIPGPGSTVLIPKIFQIEFIPSNSPGNTPGDELTMYFTIGYSLV